MYKNFNLTDEERKEIMEMHKSHGYKKPLNETADNSLDVNEGEMSIVKKTINAILKKNGIKKVESHSTSVKGFRRYSGSGYEHNYGGSLSLYNMPEDTVKDIADQMKAAGVKVVTVYNNGFSYDPRELNTSDESINELDDKDIDLIRGKATQKWSRAGKQFQQDFENDFADPAEEPVPFWEKDKPRPSDDSEIETDIRTNARQANRELGKKSEKDTIFQDREERIKLSRRIASLVSHREEFGGDDELDNLIRRLRAQAMDMDDSRQPSVTSDETSNLNEGVRSIVFI